MIVKVKEYSKKNHLIEGGDHIVLGISGGADSVCLFFLLQEIKVEFKLSITAVHINHGIREQAKSDELFVRELCEKYEVPLFVITESVPDIAAKKRISVEEAGREVRYQAFEKIKRYVGATKIAIAHNQNDQAETVLFHLFRGCGMTGLQGILPERETIIRPLLCVSRVEIEDYILQKGIAHIVDETNFENQYTRNYIRNEILPSIRENISSNVDAHIFGTAAIVQEVEDYLNIQTNQTLLEMIKGNELLEAEETITIQVVPLLEKHPAIRANLIRFSLEKLTGCRKDISRIHIESILKLCEQQVSKKIALPYSLCAVRGYENIVIYKEGSFLQKEHEEMKTDLSFELPIIIPGQTFLDDGSHLETKIFPNQADFLVEQKKYTKWFDYDKIEKCLMLRNRKEGDYFFFNETSRQTIKSYMINEKIPKEDREKMIILAQENHVIWVVGYRISNDLKVTKNTKNILEVTFIGGKEHGGKSESDALGRGSGSEN